MTTHLQQNDPEIFHALSSEVERQQWQLELIASENIVSDGVLEALGHKLTNKTLEGYPGKRFHGGGEFADITEQAAIDRAKKLFDCDYVNVQPHSGTQANQAVFFSLLKPGDKVLSLDLAAGGHLSHGAPPNQSGRWFDVQHYGVESATGRIDYDHLATQAESFKPALLIAGGSAYPREIDFQTMAEIAKRCGARFLVDMAHIAGLVAGGAHPSPIPWADIVTCTTTKTLRGPRGGLILSRDQTFASKLQSAIFPGVQGSLHTNVIAAKAVCLGEALQPDFKIYAADVIENARVMADVFLAQGINLVSKGTDTHLLLLDFSDHGFKGQQVQDLLAQAGITSNKNPVPGDARKPADWVGLRLGTAAITTRGFSGDQAAQLAEIISKIIHTADEKAFKKMMASYGEDVRALCAKFPI